MTEVDVQKILNAGKTIMECCKKERESTSNGNERCPLAMKMVNVCG